MTKLRGTDEKEQKKKVFFVDGKKSVKICVPCHQETQKKKQLLNCDNNERYKWF